MKKIIPTIIDGKTYNMVESTGELVDFDQPFYAETEDERLIRLDIIEKKKNQELKKEYVSNHYKTKGYGNFIWAVYSMSQRNYTQIKPSNLTRLMFISTYLGYGGYLETKNHDPITKSKLNELMRLSNGEFYNCIKELKSNKILYEDNDKIYINSDLFSKGDLKTSIVGQIYTEQQAITRIYINAVRSLYNSATLRSHRTLSYVFQVMPFVNRQFNIVCYNPLEGNPDEVKAMNFGEFCDAIGYNKEHAKRLRDIMFAPKFIVNKKEMCAIKYVTDETDKHLDSYIYVNPRVYYAGDQWEKVEVLDMFTKK